MSPRPHPRRWLTAGLAAAAVGVCGCGITNPYASHQPATTTHTTSAAHLLGSTSTTPSPSAVHAQDPSEPATTTTADDGVTAPAGSGPSTPRAALEHYTHLYVNWTAPTLGAHERRLAAMSAGTARANALQAAASYGHDPLLKAGQVSNRGQIVSLAAGQGPKRGWWIVVTSEHTTGRGDYQGLPTTAHVTYAQLTDTPSGWLVTQWSPQS